ncbi:hypothetical protein BRD18_00145 [Halobacteriales archaeon SW_7_71_33]|nr:MAG: hypothetical protein BRD18_00145 [Halobacteriales archaeon SW_7_71_33]
MGDDGGQSLRETLARRGTVLAALHSAPRNKPALVDTLPVSRSTVDRAIDELTEADLIERVDGDYRPTTAGEVALDCRRPYVERTDTLAAARPVLNAVDDTDADAEVDIDPVFLQHASVTVADPSVPENALGGAVDRLTASDRLRGFAAVVKPSYVSMLHGPVTGGDLSVEVIVERATREGLADLAYGREQFADLLDSDDFEMLEVERDLPYALWLMDDENETGGYAGVAVHETGGVAGLLATEHEPAVDWCRERYDAVRAAATPLPVDAVDL